MSDRNGTRNEIAAVIPPNSGGARKKGSDKDRISALEGEVERLGGALDRALYELRSMRQRLEEANARKRTGDLGNAGTKV
jgi:TolA-binding protein